MHVIRRIALAALVATAGTAWAAGPNKVAGTWRLVSSVVEPEGLQVYGPAPKGQLVFTDGLRFVAVLHDPRIPRYASSDRSKGTAGENQAAVSGSLGMYGQYLVDANGEFAGITVEGATFPNLIGVQRGREHMTMTVDGDRITEVNKRPNGSRMVNIWQRER